MRLAVAVLAFGCAAAGCGAALDEAGGATAAVVVDVPVPSPPPPDRAEPPRPVSPGFGYIWVAGHWDNLDGAYIWKDGRWLKGRSDYEYVRGRYEFAAAKQQWIYHRPHWKRRHAAALVVATDGGV